MHEQIVADCVGFYVRGTAAAAPARVSSAPQTSIRQCGLEDDEALLPVTRRRSRVIGCCRNISRFPSASCSSGCSDLREARARLRWRGDRDLLVMERAQTGARERAGCQPVPPVLHAGRESVPAAQLDRMHVTRHDTEHHLRAGPQPARWTSRFYSSSKLEGIGAGGESITRGAAVLLGEPSHRARRRPTRTTPLQRRPRLYVRRGSSRRGARSGYIGSECFMSLVDSRSARSPARSGSSMSQALCTNRDLPIQLAHGQGAHGFHCRRRRAGRVDPLHRRAELSAAVAGVRRYGLEADQPSVAQLSVARRSRGPQTRRGDAARDARAVCRPERCRCRCGRSKACAP